MTKSLAFFANECDIIINKVYIFMVGESLIDTYC